MYIQRKFQFRVSMHESFRNNIGPRTLRFGENFRKSKQYLSGLKLEVYSFVE